MKIGRGSLANVVAKFIVYAFGIDVTYSGPGGGYMDGLIGGFLGGLWIWRIGWKSILHAEVYVRIDE